MGIFSGLRSLVSENKAVTMATERAHAAENMVEILTEGFAQAELMLEDTGWRRLTGSSDMEFSRDGLQRAAEVSRVMAVADTLIKRGLALRHAYIWGQGVTVSAEDTGAEGTQDVNTLVQALMDDDGNKRALFGAQARETLERALGTDGNVFIACFTNPLTGYVQLRTIPFDEIQDVITNPEDASEPWFYKRIWSEEHTDLTTGQPTYATRIEYYPAVGYYPTAHRVQRIQGDPVHWHTPIYHVTVNGLSGWKFGIGDAYTALTWARLYRDFLLDWATLIKSLSQFAWRATGKKSKAQKAREALQRRPNAQGPDGNPNNVGATFVADPDVSLEAIPKHGATIDSESGRPIATLIAAAMGVPVTTLLADPGQTGARAVAETLNFPTRVMMGQRQSVWGEAYRAIFGHAIRAAVKAPRGPLQGSFTRDPYTGREQMTLAGGSTGTINIDWPSLEDELPIDTLMNAIVKADTTRTVPKLEILRLILKAFTVENADEIIEQVTDDNGDFIDPYMSAGQAAVDAFRDGRDPADMLR